MQVLRQNHFLQKFSRFAAAQIILNNIYSWLDLITTKSKIWKLPITMKHVLQWINYANFLQQFWKE